MSKEEKLQLENALLLTCSKAQAINKYIDELEESSKSQEENKKLKEIIDKAIELTKNILKTEDRGYYQILFKEILKSLGGKDNE